MSARAGTSIPGGPARGRGGLITIGILVATAAVLGLLALGGSRGTDLGVVTSITTTTQAPTTTSSPGVTVPDSTMSPATTPTSAASSDLAAIISSLDPSARGSALLMPPRDRAEPTRIRVDRLKIDVRIIDVGATPNGELDVPDVDLVGWYRPGAAPDESGATVLAAHVTWGDQFGPFLELGTLEAGDPITVTVDDGSLREYVVTERHQYPKDALPPDRIWTTDGPETLVLITCGGGFDDDIRRFDDNVVVYAQPVQT